MKSRSTALFVLASLVLVLFTVSAVSGQQIGSDTLARRGANTRVEWRPQIQYESAVLTVDGPDGFVYQQKFASNEVPYFQTYAANGQSLTNGSYTYELKMTPLLPANIKADLAAAGNGQEREVQVAELTQAGLLPDDAQMVVTGYLYIQDGKFLTDSLEEEVSSESLGDYSTNSISSPTAVDDFVINDDLIVTFSACIGTDCVNGENFGFDTLRLKENNLRIKFQDTSVGTFPSTDWQLTANDSTNGGANRFSIDDVDSGRTPFTIVAGAPSNSLYVSSSGRVGFGTSTPVLELHVVDGDTPALRLQQDGSSGFAAQTWDVAGNEAGFFVRDVTNGSRLSFRIEPGAPSSSIHIEANGDVGIGTSSASAPVHVRRTDGTSRILVQEASSTIALRSMLTLENNGNPQILFRDTNQSSEEWRIGIRNPQRFEISRNGTGVSELQIDSSGNLTVSGTINGSSSRDLKENLVVATDGSLLDRVMDLSVYYYNYKADDDSVQHIGPTSEDFAAAFGVGADNKHISPMDMAGVAIAAVQELYQSIETTSFEVRALHAELASQQDRIDELEAQNADLEARLAALEALVMEQMKANSGD